MHIRLATAADMAAVHDCWLATDFTDPSEYAAMVPLGIAPWWPHLYEHGRLLVAEADGLIVGLAGTQTRGRICYLADCFVRPDWQSHGIAKALLAQLHSDPTLIHCTLASSDYRAVSRYLRAGMVPRWPMYFLATTDVTRIAAPQLAVTVCSDVDAWMHHDRQFLGFDRRVDIDHFFVGSTESVLLQLFAGTQLVGQAVVQKRRYDLSPLDKRNIGPVAAFDVAYAAAVLQSTVAWAVADGAVSANLRVPAEHPGLAVLLDCGLQISDVETFCASEEWFDPRCYAPSGIM